MERGSEIDSNILGVKAREMEEGLGRKRNRMEEGSGI